MVISRMNTELMSHLFPDDVSRVMALASDETQDILNRVLLSSPEAGAKL